MCSPTIATGIPGPCALQEKGMFTYLFILNPYSVNCVSASGQTLGGDRGAVPSDKISAL